MGRNAADRASSNFSWLKEFEFLDHTGLPILVITSRPFRIREKDRRLQSDRFLLPTDRPTRLVLNHDDRRQRHRGRGALDLGGFARSRPAAVGFGDSYRWQRLYERHNRRDRGRCHRRSAVHNTAADRCDARSTSRPRKQADHRPEFGRGRLLFYAAVATPALPSSQSGGFEGAIPILATSSYKAGESFVFNVRSNGWVVAQNPGDKAADAILQVINGAGGLDSADHTLLVAGIPFHC